MAKKSTKRIDLTKRKSLAKEMGIVIFCVTCALMAALLLITSGVVKTQTSNSYYELANELAFGRSQELDKWLDIYKNDLKVYTESDVVQTGDAEAVIEWLHKHPNLRNPDYDSIT